MKLFTLFLRFCQCLGSCFCTPCIVATAVFGFMAVGLGVVALGFFGIIPIPISWSGTGSSNCNCNDTQRNIFVSYENVTVIDRLFPSTSDSTIRVTGKFPSASYFYLQAV
jgi:hypothetical protein